MEAKLKIEAVQTVIPMKPTDHPRPSFRVSIPENVGSSIYKTSFNLIFCYKNSSEEETGSLVAGWIKESLGMALSQQPILAGRLRQEEEGGEGEMEIVSNDSGIRLIEAQIDVTLQEFLDLKNLKDVEDVLVFWKDIDHEINPQFSPLFYIQVTSFSSGGYSIGISCSLILIDPFSMINFLKSWTKIHLQLISNSPDVPLFYRQNHRSTSPSINQSIGQATKVTCNSQTSIFNMGTKILNMDNNIHKNLAEMCIYEAEKKIGVKPISRFVLYVKELSEEVKIRMFYKEGLAEIPFISISEINCANFDDLGDGDICFIKDNKALYSSCWINVVDDVAVMIVFPSLENGGSGMKIIATLPVES